MRTKSFLASGLAIAAAIVAVPATSSAQVAPQNVVCRGTLGAITVDNVEVPEFARCTLNGTRVLGSVEAQPFSRVTVSAARVSGNVQAVEATSVVVSDSTIAGGVEIVQGGVARVARNSIGGGLKIEQQFGVVAATGNRVGVGVNGDLQLFSNLGGTTVSNNRVTGNLQCQDNFPVPTGGRNIVTGNKEDQCLFL